MARLVTQLRGRLRLARGRCPACDSTAPEGCGVCLGYRMPFPVASGTLRRWEARFEASLAPPSRGMTREAPARMGLPAPASPL